MKEDKKHYELKEKQSFSCRQKSSIFEILKTDEVYNLTSMELRSIMKSNKLSKENKSFLHNKICLRVMDETMTDFLGVVIGYEIINLLMNTNKNLSEIIK